MVAVYYKSFVYDNLVKAILPLSPTHPPAPGTFSPFTILPL